jgi:hypothetical protein
MGPLRRHCGKRQDGNRQPSPHERNRKLEAPPDAHPDYRAVRVLHRHRRHPEAPGKVPRHLHPAPPLLPVDGVHFQKDLKALAHWTYQKRRNDDIGAVNPDGSSRGLCAGYFEWIDGVTGLAGPFPIDLIVKHDFVDLGIDERRTFITRCVSRPTGDRILFFAQDGEATFEEIVVRPLAG